MLPLEYTIHSISLEPPPPAYTGAAAKPPPKPPPARVVVGARVGSLPYATSPPVAVKPPSKYEGAAAVAVEWSHSESLETGAPLQTAVAALCYPSYVKPPPPPAEPKVRAAFDKFDTDKNGELDASELQKALTQLGEPPDSAVMATHGPAAGASFALPQFRALLNQVLSTQRHSLKLPLKIALFDASAPAFTAGAELATCEVPLTKGVATAVPDLSHSTVFFKSATGSNYASAVVSANPEASLAPLLAVRKLFLEIDNNTGGSTDLISMNELVTLCQKMGVAAATPQLVMSKSPALSLNGYDLPQAEGVYRAVAEALGAGSAAGSGGGGGGAPLDRDTFLFEKRFQLSLVSGKPAAFWIDAHATLEVVEVSHSPGALLLMSAHDAGKPKTSRPAVLYDANSNFHLTAGAPVNPQGTFPGPLMYQFSTEGAPAAGLPVLLRVVTRYEKYEIVDDPTHPLMARKAFDPVFGADQAGAGAVAGEHGLAVPPSPSRTLRRSTPRRRRRCGRRTCRRRARRAARRRTTSPNATQRSRLLRRTRTACLAPLSTARSPHTSGSTRRRVRA